MEVGVDDPLLHQFILDAVVHHFRIVLGTYSGQRSLFGFRDPQTVEGIFDVLGEIIPAGAHPGIGPHVGDDIGHVQAADIRAPYRIGNLVIKVQGFQPGVQHPFGFVFLGRDFPDYIRSQPCFRLVFVIGSLLEIVHVAEISQCVDGLPFFLQFLFVSRGFPGQRCVLFFRHCAHPPVISCKRRSRWLRFPGSGKHLRS